MDDLSFQTLDLPELIEGFGPFFISDAGREVFLRLPTHLVAEELEQSRIPVRAVLRRLQAHDRPPFTHLDDPSQQRRHIMAEGVLDGRILRLFAQYLQLMGQTRQWLIATADADLMEFGRDWPDFGDAAREILRRIDGEGQPDPRQNPSLAQSLARLAAAREKRLAGARRILNTVHPEVWQDSNFVDRGSRILLPLKSDFRGRVAGIVHAASQTGQTLFLEPFELVTLNNDCIEAEESYHREVQRILQELAGRLRNRAEELDLFLSKSAEWESILARALWGMEHAADFPGLVPPGAAWELIEARHPLLGARAIGVSLRVPEHGRGLVISGPNTGGKTVLLKTIAVLSWLNQRACPVPANPSSSLPLFADWITDLGDHQSLETNLSTYSAHLARQKFILEEARPGTLVILDELGSGTDPREGGVIALALLEELDRLGVFTLVSTHHHLIKNYPRQAEGYWNIGMEFDTEKGRPTYRVIADSSGSSHALETAAMVGLPPRLLARARSLLEEGSSSAERRLARLDDEEARLRQRLADLEEREAALQRRLTELELERQRLLDQRRDWEEGRLKEKERLLAEFRRDFERLVREYQAEPANPASSRQVREWLREQGEDLKQEIDRQTAIPPKSLREEFLPGEEVSYQDKSAILEREVRPGIWRARVGTLRIDLAASEFSKKEQGASESKSKIQMRVLSEKRAVYTLDLRGDRVEEALRRLDEQIDHALLEGLGEFQVIHGVGEGHLRRAVTEYLSRHAHVREYYHPKPEEGGHGKTIVRL